MIHFAHCYHANLIKITIVMFDFSPIKHIITVNFYYTVQLPFWLIAIPQHLVHIHNNGDFD
jgi:uncharacterized membrane protein YesL